MLSILKVMLEVYLITNAILMQCKAEFSPTFGDPRSYFEDRGLIAVNRDRKWLEVLGQCKQRHDLSENR